MERHINTWLPPENYINILCIHIIMEFAINGDILPEWMRGRIKKFRITTSILKSTVEIEFYEKEKVKDD